ncbi:hypothetical protein HYW17_00280 [Candidatus Uhrbacteria bacterium]|nr:hypothetical protein [Candidatus Uhrbacteria bacterium]
MYRLFISRTTFLRSIAVVLGAFVVVALAVRASHTSTTIGTNVVTGNVTAHDVTGSGALSITGASTLTGNVTAAGDLAVNGGDITTTATTWNLDVGSTGTIRFRDGTNNLMTIADAGTTGNVTVTGTLTVDGASTLTGNVTASGTLAVTGALTNSADKTDGRIFIGPEDCNGFTSAGALNSTQATMNRDQIGGNAADIGSYLIINPQGANQSNTIVCDITSALLRTTASKGFQINSLDEIYFITAGLTLDSHSVTLKRIAFASSAVPTFTTLTTTGTAGTTGAAVTGTWYVTNYPVSSPAFHNTDDAKYIVDIAVQADSGAFVFHGLLLNVDYNYL